MQDSPISNVTEKIRRLYHVFCVKGNHRWGGGGSETFRKFTKRFFFLNQAKLIDNTCNFRIISNI